MKRKWFMELLNKVITFFKTSSNRPSWVVYLTFIIGLSFTGCVSVYFELYQKTISLQLFNQKILKFKMGLEERNLHYQNLLKSLSALFNTREKLSYSEWQLFLDRIISPQLFSALLGIGYIEYVSPSSLPNFKKDLERQFNKPVIITPQDASIPMCLVKYPSKLREQNAFGRDPMVYLGFNACSRPESYAAMMQARRQAKGILTSLIHLEDDNLKKWSTLIAYFPVYTNTHLFDKDTKLDDRIKNLKGWISLSLDIHVFLDDFIPENTYVEISDNNKMIYTSGIKPNNSNLNYVFKTLSGGREWVISIYSLALVNSFYSTVKLVIFIIGFILSLLTSIFIWSLLSTKRRAMEIAYDISKDLQISEFKNRTMINNIPGAIFRCIPNINWRMEFISDGIQEITGYSPQDFVSNVVSLSTLLHKSDIELVETTIGLSPKLNYSYFVEYRLLHKEGSIRWIYERGQVIKDHDTGALFLTGALFDITERKENERDLRKLTVAMQNIMEGMVFLNTDFRFVTLNQSFVSLIKAPTAHDVIGKYILEYVHPSFQKDFIQIFKIIPKKDKKTINFKALRYDGTEFYALLSIVPAYDDDSTCEGYFCFIRDITDRITEETKLAQALEEAHQANKAKSEFLATMSHELRTPLNAIIGYSEMLIEENEDSNKTLSEDLKKINYSGRHLLDLINDILDVSKLEAGKVTVFLEKFNILELILNLKVIITPNVEKNQNIFNVDCPEDIGDMYSDFMKIKQGLLNLLSNAAKFTTGGTITLKVEEVAFHKREFIKFSVTDTGCGITPEQIKKLFQPFNQADSSTTRKYGGTGLGLTITKQFIEILGGTVLVESKPLEGSTFSFSLPRISRNSQTDITKDNK